MQLWGPQRLILQAASDLQGESSEFINDTKIAAHAKMVLGDVRNCLLTLEGDNLLSLVRTTEGYIASVEAKGRLALSLPIPISTLQTERASGSVKIRPKGLQSFDSQDADFFLELLSGPRGKDGLPESINYWKSRIEEREADQTFRVGVIYGPSGCGKSSLVKAGLLPFLASDIRVIFVEATPQDTEAKLLNRLRKQCPDLPNDLGLAETLAVLGKKPATSSTGKVVIVLDQFEQWLSAKREEEHPELVNALHLCDGERLQAIVMVRVDFWMALTRFMVKLEIALQQGKNFAAIDLFDLRHAKKVLMAFGEAYGALPDDPGKVTQDQQHFVERVIAELAEGERIAPVRLVLFAEMVKGKNWIPQTLTDVGGAKGVGVSFLEETFDAAQANPRHRLHKVAAQSLLKAFLPENGTDIRGQMRSYQHLLEASGYASRAKDFEELLRILDSELRLITPTEPAEADAQTGQSQTRSGLYYQLTHDYLVPSLREWLTRKQKETRRGRAELLLEDRAAVWNARPENRQLPSLLQWLQIRCLTQKKTWTVPQRKMMRKASRYHAVRAAAVVLLLAVVTIIGLTLRERQNANHASDLVGRLLDTNITKVPGIIGEMEAYRTWIDPRLRDEKERTTKDSGKQLHLSLALLPVDSRQVGYLHERMLIGEPQEVVEIRNALLGHKTKTELMEQLWMLLENPKNDQDKRFRAACALAAFAPKDERWKNVSSDVAEMLVNQEPFTISQWTDAMKPVGNLLLPPMAEFLTDERRSVSAKGLIAKVYGEYAVGTPDAYARLEELLTKKSKPNASIDAKIVLAKRQASIGVALLLMGQGENVWPLLKHQADPTMRSYLMERLGPSGVDPKVLLVQLEEEKEVTVKRAILLSLGEFGLDRLSLADRRNHLGRLLKLYQDDPDPGIHGATEWLLRDWEQNAWLTQINHDWAKDRKRREKTIDRIKELVRNNNTSPQWYVNGEGHTMVVVPRPDEFWMGDGGFEAEKHRRKIGRSFAIASKQVTRKQFPAIMNRDPSRERDSPTLDCPATSISWYDAAEYCNKLSEKEGIDSTQWCYIRNKGEYVEGMTMARNYLQRTGYRLPTEAEWEFSCRAGSQTAFSFGEAEEILVKYGWYFQNASDKSHPVGSLKPNDLGLFDMHGNVLQWCQNAHHQPYPKGDSSKVHDDKDDDIDIITDNFGRVLRGGSFDYRASDVRSANRVNDVPTYSGSGVGFRVARTLPLGSFTALQPSPEGGGK